mgnify:FL=1
MTEKQKLFAENYLANGFNARGAYYSAFGENPNKQPSYPYTLLKNKEVAAYIEKRRKEIYESLNIDAIRVMSEIADIAFEPRNEKNVAAKLKALELLSKNLSLQTVKTENKDVIEVTLVEDETDV